MNLVLKIARRNIFRHRGKSLVIGLILFIGALLMTFGNGVISGMERGIKRNIVNGFMGDIVIVSSKQRTDNILLNMMGTSIETIGNYKDIKKILAGQDYVERFLPAGKNLAMTLNSGSSNPGFVYLLGVDFKKYQEMFPDTLTTVEGRLLNPGEQGILIPTAAREEFYNYTNTWFLPEGGRLVKENLSKEALKNVHTLSIDTSVVLMGMNETNSATDIRFGVKGIVRYRSLNTIFGHFSITDIESYRNCLGYFSSDDRAVEVPKEEQKLLGMDAGSLDALFTDTGLIVSDKRSVPRVIKNKNKKPSAVAQDSEAGAYNLVFVKLKDRASVNASLKKLNRALSDANAGARAITWKQASGPVGGMTTIIKGALFMFVTLLFIVAIIIIINTLTMSALERTPEIGMMRAIGARKGFISGMFIGETSILSAVFGGTGIVAGIIVINAIPLLGIKTSNDLLQLLYGGDIFHPLLSVSGIGVTLFQLAVVTLLAAFYPMTVARSITPLDAVTRD